MKLITTFFFIFWLCQINAQDLKTYVEQHTNVVRTVSPLDTSYDDLKALGKAIGDARIVMLGEQDHGDAPAFLAKSRIIQYLHEKKGFNVLAFESDFYALNQGLDLLGNKATTDSFTRFNIFPIWTFCDACAHLFYQYLPATRTSAQPLQLAGFDCQMILQQSRKDLVPRLDSVFRALDLPVTKRSDYITEILPALKRVPDYYGKAPGNLNQTIEYLSEIGEQIMTKLPANDPWRMVVTNLIAEANEFSLFMGNNKQKQMGSKTRDRQMAENLRWLATYKFPATKIIVWAANSHIGKYGSGNPDDDLSWNTMGQFFTMDEAWKKQTYILGFASFQGEAGRLGQDMYKVRKANPRSFESWINKDIAQAFVDFTAFRQQYPSAKSSFHLKSFGHYTNFPYDWTTVFDGVFYIRDMYSCKALKQ